MRKMERKREIKIFGAFVLLVILLCACVFPPMTVGYAYAAESVGSPVLTDLMKDPSFDPDAWEQRADDYSLELIQIAESTDGELLLYVYQPIAKRSVKASSVNIARDQNNMASLTFDNYKLSFVDCMGVFFKYRVVGFQFAETSVRYYNISNILRPYIFGIDIEPDNDNKTGEIGYRVGQLWTVITAGEEVTYEKSVSEVIVVTDEMVGFKRYNDGFYWDGTKYCDAHFVAFNTDRDIDRIVTADLEFYSTAYWAREGQKTKYYEPVYHKKRLTHGEMVENDGGGWFGSSNQWNRIASVDYFLHEVKWTAEESKTISKYQWVLNFYESRFVCEAGGKDVLICALVPFGFIWTIVNGCTTKGEVVSDVLLLNLEFEANDEVYSMGVVANRQTGSTRPIGTDEVFNFLKWLSQKTGLPQWALVLIIIAVALLIVLPLLIKFLPDVFYAIIKGIAWGFKGLWWLICLPFRGIAALIRKNKEKSQ